MPELPEVETVRRGLEPVLAGATIAALESRRPDLRFPLPERFQARVEGKRILRLGRRAKYLVAELDSDELLVMHLGMSGRFSITPPPDKNTKPTSAEHVAEAAFTHAVATNPAHDHVVFHTDTGAIVTYNDPRRFGFMAMMPEAERDTHKLFANLGPEPLGNAFSAAHLARAADGRRTDLKAFLLDQRTVAGLGNIYVCEALYRAGLSPKRMASALSKRNPPRPTDRAQRLAVAIRNVLREAIAAGGSTLRDYAHTDGSLGYFQHGFAVYGRQGAPCKTPGCKATIQRLVQSARSTFYCPACQR